MARSEGGAHHHGESLGRENIARVNEAIEQLGGRVDRLLLLLRQDLGCTRKRSRAARSVEVWAIRLREAQVVDSAASAPGEESSYAQLPELAEKEEARRVAPRKAPMRGSSVKVSGGHRRRLSQGRRRRPSQAATVSGHRRRP